MDCLKMPYSMEAEVSTLGSMLIDKESLILGVFTLNSKDFYIDSHSIVFDAMKEVHSKGKPVDIVTVTEYLDAQKKLEGVGGVGFLAQLAESVPTTANSEYYMGIVKEKAQLRTMIEAGKRLQEMGYNAVDAKEAIDKAESILVQVLSSSVSSQGMTKTKEFIYDFYNNLQSRKGSNLVGLSTGYSALDRITGGLQKSDLIIIAGRPSMGKTALALNISQNNCRNQKKVDIFSLEMSKEQLLERMVCAEANIPSEKLKLGNLTEDEWKKVKKVLGEIKEWELQIDDNPNTTIADIKSKLRKSHSEKPIDLVVIDYLGLISDSPNSKTGSKADAIAEKTKALKQIARELDVPILLLAQLNRSVEQREDKRPIMSDLRDSGAIEQDADVIIFTYRDEYYDADSPKKGIAEIIISKQRRGATGTVELAFIKNMTKFANLESRRG